MRGSECLNPDSQVLLVSPGGAGWWGVRGLWLEVEDPFLPGRLEKEVILFGGTTEQYMMETEKQTSLYL